MAFSRVRRRLIVASIVAALLVYGIYQSFAFRWLLYQHYPGVSYYHIATQVAGREKDELKRLELLTDYVYQNVFTGGFQVIDLPPLDNLVRGIAWCDQSAHILIRLLEPFDVRGYLVFLNSREDGSGTSPHSVAIVTPGIKENIMDYSELTKVGVTVDTLQGVVVRTRSGAGASFKDICAGDVSEAQKRYFVKFPFSLFCNRGRSFLSNTPISLDNKKRRFFYNYLFPMMPKGIINLYQDMVLDRWYRKNFKNDLEFLYFRARNYHVYGRFDEALRLYDTVIRRTPDRQLAAGCTFFEGMSYFRMGEFDSAFTKLKEVTEKYIDSPWSAVANRWLDEAGIRSRGADGAKK